jgi:hypothetical protein
MKAHKRGYRYQFEVQILGLVCNSNAVHKTTTKGKLNLSGLNLGKIFDPMNLLEPALSKKIQLSCKRGAVAYVKRTFILQILSKGRTKTGTFNINTLAYEWEDTPVFQFTSFLEFVDSGSPKSNQTRFHSKEVKFHLTKVCFRTLFD